MKDWKSKIWTFVTYALLVLFVLRLVQISFTRDQWFWVLMGISIVVILFYDQAKEMKKLKDTIRALDEANVSR